MGKKSCISRTAGKFIYFEQILFKIKDENVALPKKLKLIKLFSGKLNDFTIEKTAKKETKFNKLYKKVTILDEEFEKIFYEAVIPELSKQKIFIKNFSSLDENQIKFANEFFDKQIKPALTPYSINEDSIRSFFKNGQRYLILKTESNAEQDINTEPDKDEKKNIYEYVLIEIPSSIPKFINIQSETVNVFPTEEAIKINLDKILPEQKIIESYFITLRLKNETENEWMLFARQKITDAPFKGIGKILQIKKKNILSELFYPGIIDLISFISKKINLRDEEIKPAVNLSLDKSVNMFQAIAKQDILLCFPFHSFEQVINFFQQASNDPFVSEMKLTQSQLSQNPNIIVALLNAVKTGKRVTVFTDEDSDINALNDFRESGLNIIFNTSGLSLDSGVAQVKRRENDGEKSYIYFSTKNSDGKDNATDFALFTCNEAISRDINYFFNFLELGTKGFEFEELLVSGLNMRKNLSKLIENEIKNAEQSKDGYIMLKMNNLEDKKMIDLISDASAAGVKIKLLISETCLLETGHWLNQNIQLKYLINLIEEHSRVFIFYNDGEPVIYISSSDWTKEDFSKKAGIAFPVKQTNLRTAIVEMFNLYCRSTQNAVSNYIKSESI